MHGTFLYDATIRVPLLMKLPADRPPPSPAAGFGGTTNPDVLGSVDASSRDAVNTDLAHDHRGARGDAHAQRRPGLLPLVAGQTGSGPPAYAESYYQNVLLGWSPLRAVRTRRWKFIARHASSMTSNAIRAGGRLERAALVAGSSAR
jgi:hypothetical protein